MKLTAERIDLRQAAAEKLNRLIDTKQKAGVNISQHLKKSTRTLILATVWYAKTTRTDRWFISVTSLFDEIAKGKKGKLDLTGATRAAIQIWYPHGSLIEVSRLHYDIIG
jgi:hypothetical protein